MRCCHFATRRAAIPGMRDAGNHLPANDLDIEAARPGWEFGFCRDDGQRAAARGSDLPGASATSHAPVVPPAAFTVR